MNPRYEMPDTLYFGGGGDTYITPLALAILISAVFLICLLPRRYAVVPLLAAGLWLPASVNIVVAGFHFSAIRVLLLVGWISVLGRREVRLGRFNALDKVLLFWALYSATIFCLLWGWAAVANRVGFLYTTLGSYFLLRVMIRDKADVLRVVTTFAIALMLLAPFLIEERATGHNPLSILGASELSAVRYENIRVQGPFLHPIICGTLGAMLLPIFIALWWQGKRRIAVLGVSASAIMTIVSSSSTPLMTFGAGLVGFLLWPARRRLRWFRWGFVASIVGLQFVMKAPVWYVIAHVGAATGGSGWHRATLIDMFIRHFGEWWLYGTRNNADWGYYMWDVDNAFVNSGLQGGLVTFILFVALFVYGFKRIGSARQKAERSPKDARFIWAIGCALFANAVAFFGIFYFDQSILVWYGLLAMISATGSFVVDPSAKRLPQAASVDSSAVSHLAESEIPVPQLSL